jgi:hypothetical protein
LNLVKNSSAAVEEVEVVSSVPEAVVVFAVSLRAVVLIDWTLIDLRRRRCTFVLLAGFSDCE